MNADAFADLVVCDINGAVYWIPNSGSAPFLSQASMQTIVSSGSSVRFALADLDGTGQLDLLFVERVPQPAPPTAPLTARVRFVLNTGAGSFLPSANVVSLTENYNLGFFVVGANIVGTTNADALVAEEGGSVYYYVSGASGPTGTRTTLATGLTGISWMSAGTVANTGRTDLVVTTATLVIVFVNDGAGVFSRTNVMTGLTSGAMTLLSDRSYWARACVQGARISSNLQLTCERACLLMLTV